MLNFVMKTLEFKLLKERESDDIRYISNLLVQVSSRGNLILKYTF